ncbi:MAG: hypothetical protein MJ214_05485 [Bacilli bacterium]|nr:hypothetical protein [Bacilli bacterium]
MEVINELIMSSLPEIITGVVGLAVGFIFYLSKRIKYKTAVTEKEIENVKLQEAIINSSYIICPGCGKQVFLKDTKIYTGGVLNEDEK